MKTITLATVKNVYKSPLVSVETAELQGYELIKELFVDSSGFGQENELACTQNQFMSELTTLLNEYGKLYTCITRLGQFQVYVGVFKKVAKLSKKIAGNTLEINKPNEKIIRLYDTNIVTFRGNTIILDNGGYPTRTTHKRMNNALPSGYSVRAALGVSELHHNGKCTPFIGGMLTITL